MPKVKDPVLAKHPQPSHGNVSIKVARTHAEGKPVRGIRGPGKRGPARHVAEAPPPKLVTFRHPPQTPDIMRTVVQPAAMLAKTHHQRAGRELSDLILAIGNEVVDQNTGWTRLTALVRKLYADGLAGKHDATKILLERAYGKVPKPVQLSVRTEILSIISQQGLTIADAAQDPILSELLKAQGLLLEGTIIEGELDHAE